MGKISVRGHHKVVDGKKIWVEEYFRNGERLSDEEAEAYRRKSSIMAKSGVMLASNTGDDPTLGGYEEPPPPKWNPETKQNKVSQLQAFLPVAEMSPEHRAAIEYHMEQFLQNENPDIDDQMAENLDAYTQHIHMEAASNRYHAEQMLHQLRHPTTQDGILMQRRLRDVLAGQAHLDDVTKGTFEDVYRQERAAQRSHEAAQESSKRLRNVQAGLEYMRRSAYNMSYSESREETVKMRRAFEEVQHSTRVTIQAIEEDPTLLRHLEQNVTSLRASMFNMETDLDSLMRSQRNGNTNNQGYIDSINRHVRIMSQSSEEVERVMRRIMVDGS